MFSDLPDLHLLPVVGSMDYGDTQHIQDVHNLKKLNYKNLLGVIIGKALFTDDIKLEEAIKISEA